MPAPSYETKVWSDDQVILGGLGFLGNLCEFAFEVTRQVFSGITANQVINLMQCEKREEILGLYIEKYGRNSNRTKLLGVDQWRN